jgi:hypothetical protein
MLILLALAVAMGVAAATVITRGLLKQLGGEPDYTAEDRRQHRPRRPVDRHRHQVAANAAACWPK